MGARIFDFFLPNNAFKENRYYNTHKIPYPVMPRRSTHSMLGPIQGRPQVQKHPGFERYHEITALGLHAETGRGCQVNYVRSWKHHGDEQKLRQYVDLDWA
ncbi:uncharacterized protein J4E88_007063 [Alternaria novae-zelandiae]|uniref:uncharacterized protein n=1 Tax=Alternaria novae-zelandiae TaxID=430562 RepID=UPI0020C333FF|nr:uncharacterized protein J4E88_007063 [Alternaria novae-zelandiae]KAI4677255.1 hypothetical protein J4E88_007063 [Alternaria novae-zelandiae]